MKRLSSVIAWLFLTTVLLILCALVDVQVSFGTGCKNIKHKDIIYIPLPFTLKFTDGTLINKVKLHKDLKIPLTKALNCVKKNGYQAYLKTYDGGYCYRTIRNTNVLSLHATGRAVDFNAKGNWYGQKPKMHLGIVRCFEASGFEWGGRWRTPDGMHFEYKDIKNGARSPLPICVEPFGC